VLVEQVVALEKVSQVVLHVLLNHAHLGEVFEPVRGDNVKYRDYVPVLEVPKDPDLVQCSVAYCAAIQVSYDLDCNDLPRMFLSGFENIAVGSTSNMLAHVVALPKVKRNQIRLWLVHG
jgi:hypothetical protein